MASLLKTLPIFFLQKIAPNSMKSVMPSSFACANCLVISTLIYLVISIIFLHSDPPSWMFLAVIFQNAVCFFRTFWSKNWHYFSFLYFYLNTVDHFVKIWLIFRAIFGSLKKWERLKNGSKRSQNGLKR